MNINEVYSLIIYMAIGVLVGGRMVEVTFYERAYHGSYVWHIPVIWLGGMFTVANKTQPSDKNDKQ